jgi:hypothetical protein
VFRILKQAIPESVGANPLVTLQVFPWRD